MAALDANVAALRTAVRRSLRPYAPRAYTPRGGEPHGPVVFVACSGGADSLALAAAVAFVAPRMGLHPGLVTVDHELQPGSAQRAATVVDWAVASGFDLVLMRRIDVMGRPGGPEAAAREARYEALVDVARSASAPAVLLGHTREDQAETVLLALLRGAGSRGLAAMPPTKIVDGVALVRPLLDVARSQAKAACAVLDLPVWQDPHNSDPSFARTHARGLLDELVQRLGPAVVANLARSAELAAADVEVIDDLARAARLDATDADGALRVESLRALPTAVRRAVLQTWVRGHGVPGAALSHRHIAALDALITGWRGQHGTSLPGSWVAARREGRLHLSR